MAFSLTTKASLSESLERVLTNEVDARLAVRAGDADTAERVHETRKSIKRLRALLRLYRGAIPHALYEREDAVLWRLGQSLGRARDAVALGESLHRLILAAPPETRTRLADRSRELEDALVAASETPKDVEAALASVHDGLGALRARATDWTIDRQGFSAIAPGLRRTYARGRRALEQARQRPSEKRLHTLRTWVKRHQYQLTLLEPLWPDPIKAFRHEAQRLGELLGYDHDLSLLERRFEALSERPELAPLEPVLRNVAEDCHSTFRREALDLGARLYAEPPGRFAARYREYFDAWP